MAIVDIGAVLSVLAGIGLTLLAWGLLHFNQRRVRRDRFRRAVLHEVDRVGEAVEELSQAGPPGDGVDEADIDRALVAISSDILESDLMRMKMLTTPEIEALYDYYEATQLLKGELERSRDGSTNRDRIEQYATRTLACRDRVQEAVFRSRLSRLTEWVKGKDKQYRSRGG